MTPRERFVHFVSVFAQDTLREGLLEEAIQLSPALLEAEHWDEQGDREAPVLERPMDAAWEFVQYRRYGAPRPYWFPRILAPTKQILSI